MPAVLLGVTINENVLSNQRLKKVESRP